MEDLSAFERIFAPNEEPAIEPDPPERRGEARTATLLRVGKLHVGDEQRLCMIRNLSSEGAMLKLYQPIEAETAVTVEVTPDRPVAARVIWVRGLQAGIAFDQPIDVVAALRGIEAAGPYRRTSRMPRMRVQAPAMLCTEQAEYAVMLCDLSLHGARVAIETKLAPKAEIALFVEGLHPLTARVRWWRDDHAGMEFDIPLQVDTLANWISGAAAT